ncbi:MAG TPA: anti-sigma factor [Acidimicrobiales bacterium]|nr:anti-sigma factor [Acidimicrobiales bacterium]
MTHADASELLGAYALDAVDPDEAAALEAHLETCPRCRAELTSHREVVGLLAYAGQEAPEGLWDRVVSRINDQGDDRPAGPPHSLRLVRVEGGAAGPGADAAESPARSRARRRWWNQATSLVAAAAVVVVALLGVEVLRLEGRTNHLSGQITAMADTPNMSDVQAALRVPGARHVVLAAAATSSDARVDAVILPGGDGYLYDSRLTPLSPAQTYQLWGVVGGQEISYGLLGSSPAQVAAFRASSGLQALAVTAEVAGGVVSSSHLPVVFGRLS